MTRDMIKELYYQYYSINMAQNL